MTISNFSDLERAVKELKDQFPRPYGGAHLTDLLDISLQTEASWPSNESPGVYIFLDSDKNITYIGKASFGSCIGARLNQRFDTKWNTKSPESEGCKYITTIAVPRDNSFEAPAIEEYLLKCLRTRSNSVGSS